MLLARSSERQVQSKNTGRCAVAQPRLGNCNTLSDAASAHCASSMKGTTGARSEERRVGKECRSLWSTHQYNITGTEEWLNQPQRLLKGERGENLTPDQQVPFQAAQPIGKLDAARQVVRAAGAEQEYRQVCSCPASAGILQHIERRSIRPLRIIDEGDDRS